MRVTLGTVVALSGRQPLLAAVVKAAGRPSRDVYHFAVPLVGMITDGAPHIKASIHYLVYPVKLRTHMGNTLATLEVGRGDLFYLIKINDHIDFIYQF